MVSVSPARTGGRPEKYEEVNRRPTPTAGPVGMSIGALLRERREALGATLAEVEAATKIRQKYLSALEADEWQALPGEVVGRGFLRNYAVYLGIEPTDVIDRRRAIADPSLSGALAPTSAGSTLPPPRAVDYRPKDVDLREDTDILEERPPLNLRPVFLGVAGVALVLVLWWGISRFGGGALDSVLAAGSGISNGVAGLFGSEDATPTPQMAVLAADTAPVDTSRVGDTAVVQELAGVPVVDDGTQIEVTDGTGTASGAADPVPVLALPTLEPPTPTPALPTPTPAPTLPPPTPTPAAQAVAVTTQANLRSAPSTDAPVAGAAEAGVIVNVVGRSSDGLWYLLDSGAWIFAQLVAAPAAPVAVTDPTPVGQVAAADPNLAAAAPADGGTGGLLLPTATPQPVEAPAPAPEPQVVVAPCADPRSAFSSPGMGQAVSGLVPLIGTATHENFASFKLEAGVADGALVFIGSGNSPVQGGNLGTLDSVSFPNGPLLIRLTVIDQTGNYPPPCELTVTVAN